MPTPYHSHHIFLFPFKWEIGNKKTQTLVKRTSLKAFRMAMGWPDEILNYNKEAKDYKPVHTDSKWYHRPFKLNRPVDYNEYAYFYDYVNEALYDLDEPLFSEKAYENLINHFEYDLPKGTSYRIQIGENASNPYILEVDTIALNIYSTGVGVLSFHLKNFKYSEIDDILKINQYGRRIYPPFLKANYDVIRTDDDLSYLDNDGKPLSARANWTKSLRESKGLELPYRIWLADPQGNTLHEFAEDFGAYATETHYQKDPFRLPNFIRGLFPEHTLVENEATHIAQKYKRVFIKPVLDDRMFVVCAVANTSFSNQVKTTGWLGRSNEHYLTNDDWYKMVFVDGGMKTSQNAEFTKTLLKAQTYTRWGNYGTLFGVSRYSFVAVMEQSEYINFIFHHCRSIYYKMAELALVERACLEKFTDEVTHITPQLEKEQDREEMNGTEAIEEDAETVVQNARVLNQAYLQFVNKLFFREITAQEQGIELYDKLRQVMRLEDRMRDLNQEIHQLHDNLKAENDERRLLTDKKREAILKLFSILSGLFLVPGFIISYFGYSVFDIEKGKLEGLDFLSAILLMLALIPLTYFWYRSQLELKKKDKWYMAIVAVLMLLLLVVIPLRLPHPSTNSPGQQQVDSLKRVLRNTQEQVDSLKRVFPSATTKTQSITSATATKKTVHP